MSRSDSPVDTSAQTPADIAAEPMPSGDPGLPPAIPSMLRIVKLAYRSEPRLLLTSLAATVLQALPDALVALWLALITDGVLRDSRPHLLVGALGLGVSAAATWFLQVTLTRTQRRLGDRLNIMFAGHIARLQASVVTIEHHERAEYLDRISILRNAVFALDHLFMSIFTMVGWLVRLVLVAVLLATIHPLLVVLLAFAVPMLAIASWRPKIERAVEERVAANDRLARHLFVLATTSPPGKELRVAGNQRAVAERRRAEWDRWFAAVGPARWASTIWLMAGWALFGGAFVVAVAWVAGGWGALDTQAGPGGLVLVLVACGRLSAYVGGAVGELGFLRGIWLDSAQRLAWLEDYAATQNEHTDADAPDVLSTGIRFEHVSFAYPGSTKLVLDDVDFELPAGAVVAVVGENGAGKTTLVKLLARMYAPIAGRITADGVDLATIPSDEWRSRMSGAFQDFARLEFHALTTVGLGDEPRQADRNAVGAAVERAGASSVVDELRAGLDTQLGPSWDEGVDVSFGQWQKLALARGYMRDEPLVLVLDEPTAALDAETEHALFEHYASTAAASKAIGRITILVSHRFSTVRMADLIVVLDGARVVEVGSHEELMVRKGPYSELYAIQARAYA